MARASGGANNMRPLSWGGGAQTEKIPIFSGSVITNWLQLEYGRVPQPEVWEGGGGGGVLGAWAEHQETGFQTG